MQPSRRRTRILVLDYRAQIELLHSASVRYRTARSLTTDLMETGTPLASANLPLTQFPRTSCSEWRFSVAIKLRCASARSDLSVHAGSRGQSWYFSLKHSTM